MENEFKEALTSIIQSKLNEYTEDIENSGELLNNNQVESITKRFNDETSSILKYLNEEGQLMLVEIIVDMCSNMFNNMLKNINKGGAVQ